VISGKIFLACLIPSQTVVAGIFKAATTLTIRRADSTERRRPAAHARRRTVRPEDRYGISGGLP